MSVRGMEEVRVRRSREDQGCEYGVDDDDDEEEEEGSGVSVIGMYGAGPGCSIVVNASGPHPFALHTANNNPACLSTAVQYMYEISLYCTSSSIWLWYCCPWVVGLEVW